MLRGGHTGQNKPSALEKVKRLDIHVLKIPLPLVTVTPASHPGFPCFFSVLACISWRKNAKSYIPPNLLGTLTLYICKMMQGIFLSVKVWNNWNSCERRLSFNCFCVGCLMVEKTHLVSLQSFLREKLIRVL